MRVLVTWGSRLGGTAGIAEIIAETLTGRGFDVTASPSHTAPPPWQFDAVIIGGSIYANRWHPEARRFVEHHVRGLRKVPTWLFSSGPLDGSASAGALPPILQVQGLLDRIGALGHATFGGRLEPTVHGFPAAAMAKQHAGDWRDVERIRAWANQLADALPLARPLMPLTPEGRSPMRLVEYGVVAWALGAALLVISTAVAPAWFALTAHAVVVPLWFGRLAARYQRAEGARSPAMVAISWLAMAAFLDLALVAGAVRSTFALTSSVAGFWLPLGLGFAAAWVAGAIAAMVPSHDEVASAQ
jgi:menaquinone-dependent protoporphyrinogen oxidase